jgi:hypothetical protein
MGTRLPEIYREIPLWVLDVAQERGAAIARVSAEEPDPGALRSMRSLEPVDRSYLDDELPDDLDHRAALHDEYSSATLAFAPPRHVRRTPETSCQRPIRSTLVTLIFFLGIVVLMGQPTAALPGKPSGRRRPLSQQLPQEGNLASVIAVVCRD